MHGFAGMRLFAVVSVALLLLLAFSGCTQPPGPGGSGGPPAAGEEILQAETAGIDNSVGELGDLQAILGDTAIEDSGICESSFE